METVKLLVEHGANPNIKDDSGKTPLFGAINNPHGLAIVEFLIQHRADPFQEDDYGNSLLHVAAYWRKPELVRFLLRLGLDANKKNAGQKTPLDEAQALSWNPEAKEEIIKLLKG